jgi:tRNA (Thr-GGU) A37 N-methylase
MAKARMVSLILCEPFTEGGSTMQVYEAVKLWLEYHKTNSREKTVRTYRTFDVSRLGVIHCPFSIR